MMEIKKSVRFRLMSRKTTDKVSGKKKSKKRNLLIVMTVRYCGNRIGLSTNLHIDEDLWDSKGQRVTGDNLYMRMSEAQINFTLEMLRTGVSSIMYNYERLNIVPTVAQFKKSFESYRISFGQTGLGIQPVPQMAATSIPPIAPLPYQSMPYMPQQMQGTYHPGYPQQPFFPSNGYVVPQQQPEWVIRENMEYSNPKWNRSTPTPNFNKDSEFEPDEEDFSSNDDDLDIDDDLSEVKKPKERVGKVNPADGVEKDIWWSLDQFVTVMGKQNEWTRSTYQKFDALENHLKKFRENQRVKLKKKKFELTFSYFDEEGLLNFVEFLSKVQENEKHVD